MDLLDLLFGKNAAETPPESAQTGQNLDSGSLHPRTGLDASRQAAAAIEEMSDGDLQLRCPMNWYRPTPAQTPSSNTQITPAASSRSQAWETFHIEDIFAPPDIGFDLPVELIDDAMKHCQEYTEPSDPIRPSESFSALIREAKAQARARAQEPMVEWFTTEPEFHDFMAAAGITPSSTSAIQQDDISALPPVAKRSRSLSWLSDAAYDFLTSPWPPSYKAVAETAGQRKQLGSTSEAHNQPQSEPEHVPRTSVPHLMPGTLTYSTDSLLSTPRPQDELTSRESSLLARYTWPSVSLETHPGLRDPAYGPMWVYRTDEGAYQFQPSPQLALAMAELEKKFQRELELRSRRRKGTLIRSDSHELLQPGEYVDLTDDEFEERGRTRERPIEID